MENEIMNEYDVYRLLSKYTYKNNDEATTSRAFVNGLVKLYREQQRTIERLNKRIDEILEINDSNSQDLMPDNFVAFDVETATYSKDICQIGLVKVVNREITDTRKYLIKPRFNRYDKSCILVHGITPEMTEDSPMLPDVWPDIKEFIDGEILISHNIAFDVDSLLRNVRLFDLDNPEVRRTICTCTLFNRAKLSDVCRHYGICQQHHHDALDDAICCAKIFLEYLKTGEVPAIEKTPSARKDRTPSSQVKVQDLSSVTNKDTAFYNKKVVITGVFQSWPVREELAQKLNELGACVNSSISKKTDIVIAGEGFGQKKMEKIQELQAEGYPIRVMRESELIDEIKKSE